MNKLVITFHSEDDIALLDSTFVKQLASENLTLQVVESLHPYTNGMNVIRYFFHISVDFLTALKILLRNILELIGG